MTEFSLTVVQNRWKVAGTGVSPKGTTFWPNFSFLTDSLVYFSIDNCPTNSCSSERGPSYGTIVVTSDGRTGPVPYVR